MKAPALAFCAVCGCALVSYGCAAGICYAPGWRVRANALEPDRRHAWAERAGIREHCGGAAPHVAELEAFREVGAAAPAAQKPTAPLPTAAKPERKKRTR